MVDTLYNETFTSKADLTMSDRIRPTLQVDFHLYFLSMYLTSLLYFYHCEFASHKSHHLVQYQLCISIHVHLPSLPKIWLANDKICSREISQANNSLRA